MREFHQRLVGVLTSLGLAFEVIYVDDGSPDRSRDLVGKLATSDSTSTVRFVSSLPWIYHPTPATSDCYPAASLIGREWGVSAGTAALFCLGGVQLVGLWVLGQHLAGIAEEVRRRPLYVVQESLNVAGYLRTS